MTSPQNEIRIGRRLRQLRTDERGAAMATVALLGAALVLLAAVVVTASVQSYEHTSSDRGWEEAIVVAESGVDDVLYELNLDRDYMADNGLEVAPSVDLSTRDAVITAAEDLAAADPGAVVSTPDGDVVVLKPEGEWAVYAVGFSPNRSAERRQVRVTQVQYEAEIVVTPNWSPNTALLSGGDLVMTNNSSTVDPGGSNAHVHANGNLTVGTAGVDGCATGYGNSLKQGVNCPADLLEAPIPEVRALEAYHLSQFDLCPNGFIKAGPAHPTTPNITGVPCMGVVAATPGWNSSLVGGVRTWVTNDGTPGGVFYIHQGNFSGKVGKNSPKPFTLIVESKDPTGTCASNSGHVYIAGGSNVTPYAGSDTAFIAEGDIVFEGNAKVAGLTMAHEQIRFAGGTGSNGAAIAESACHHPSSPIGAVSTTTGGAQITYDGTLSTPFSVSEDSGRISFVNAGEL